MAEVTESGDKVFKDLYKEKPNIIISKLSEHAQNIEKTIPKLTNELDKELIYAELGLTYGQISIFSKDINNMKDYEIYMALSLKNIQMNPKYAKIIQDEESMENAIRRILKRVGHHSNKAL